MGKQEKVNAMMHKIAEALPDESSPELTAIMLINIVLLYEQEHNWPEIMLAINSGLTDHLCAGIEEKEDGTCEGTGDLRCDELLGVHQYTLESVRGLGIEPRLSRPQREVLTTILQRIWTESQFCNVMLYGQSYHLWQH